MKDANISVTLPRPYLIMLESSLLVKKWPVEVFIWQFLFFINLFYIHSLGSKLMKLTVLRVLCRQSVNSQINARKMHQRQ